MRLNLPLQCMYRRKPCLAMETAALLWGFGRLAAGVAIIAAVSLVVVASLIAERRSAFVSAVTHRITHLASPPCVYMRIYCRRTRGRRCAASQRPWRPCAILEHAMASLIDNVLDYARLERRRAPRSQPIAIAEMCAREQVRWEQRLEQAGLQLQLAPELLNCDCCLRGDADALLRILDNLIDNACKYAQPSDPAEVRMS